MREIAKRGSASKELLVSAILLEYNGTPEIYLDDVKQENNNNNNDNSNNNNNNGNNNNNSNKDKNDSSSTKGEQNQKQSDRDDTTAKDALPKAGQSFLITLIFIITLVGIFMFIKYDRIDK